MLQDEQSCCTVQNEFDVPLFHTCRGELMYLWATMDLPSSRQRTPHGN
jgi:hypothetical protein